MKTNCCRLVIGLAVLLIGLLHRIPVLAQIPTWDWAMTPGNGMLSGTSTAVDPSGDVYFAGTFLGTVRFGATTLVSAGESDIFLTKLTATGTVEWAIQAGGTGGDICYGLEVDDAGQVYMLAQYHSPVCSLGSISLPLSGVTRSFLAKVSPMGNWLWATAFGGSTEGRATTFSVDSVGNSYIAGSFIGSFSVAGTTLTAANWQPFLIRLSAVGTGQWLKVPDPTGSLIINDVHIDRFSQSLYLTGDFSASSLTLGADVLNNASGASDLVVAKLTSTGDWLWARRLGVFGAEVGEQITTDHQGRVYLGAILGGGSPIAVGPDTLPARTGDFQVAILQLNSAGDWQRGLLGGAPGYTSCNSMLVDPNGGVYVAGGFERSAQFGATTLFNVGPPPQPPTNFNGRDTYIAKMNSSWNWDWALSTGSQQHDWASSISRDHNGDLYVSGQFSSGTIQFGSIQLFSFFGSSVESYLAKLTNTLASLPEATSLTPLTLAPNPAHETVQLTGATADPVTLLDAVGRPVRTYPAGTTTLNLRGLVPGLYTVRAGTTARRLVVE